MKPSRAVPLLLLAAGPLPGAPLPRATLPPISSLRGGSAAAAVLDAECAVQAGSPIEWLSELPKPIPTDDRIRIRRRLQGETGLLGDTALIPRYQNTDLFNYYRITTVDVTSYFTFTRYQEAPQPSKYPPPLTMDVYWQAAIVLLRNLLHPAETLEGESIQYLIYLGDCARPVCEAAANEGKAPAITRQVLRDVKPLPPGPPAPPTGKNDYEAMLYRVTWEDLTGSFPFSLTRPFAPRISLMGEEAIPYVIQAAYSDHLFLARNAVFWLGQSDHPSAISALREIFQKTDDPVIRNRCLYAFARTRDRNMAPILVKELKKAEGSYRTLLLYVLGKIGETSVVPEILQLVSANSTDFDLLAAAGAALGRLRDEAGGRTVHVLGLLKNSSFRDPTPQVRPDQPDPDGTRVRILRQIYTAARAMVTGEEVHREALLGMWKRGVAKPVVYLAIDALCTFSEGRKSVQEFIESAEDPSIRAYAVARLAASGGAGATDFFFKMASPAAPHPVNELCLRALEAFDPLRARAAAEAIVRDSPFELRPDQRYLMSLAARVLIRQKAIPAAEAVRLLENELITQEMKREEPAPAADPRVNIQNFVTPVPVIEQLVCDVGDLKDDSAVPILRDLIYDKAAPGRAEACVGLARIGGGRAIQALLDALEDPDPWVRFVSQRVLRELSGRPSECDWIYGPSEKRRPFVEAFRAWAREGGFLSEEKK